MENKKKTKGFVETPKVIVDIMHMYLSLNNNETLGDFTAGKGVLFGSHPSENCFGIEIDEENYNHIKVRYDNIIFGDFFQEIHYIPTIDALILNPPYIKQSNEIIYKSLEKLKEGGRFAIISKENTFRKLKEEYENLNIHIDMAMVFDTNLFKPFANVKTILMFGIKGKQQGKYEILEFTNEEIQVNTRAKIIEPKILSPSSTIVGDADFWEKLNEQKVFDTKPTYEDFYNTVTSYMARDTGFPVEFIRNPKKLGDAYSKLLNFYR